MQIGLFASYGMKCGIAQYNLSLYHAFKELGYAVTIFGNKPEAIRSDRRWLIAGDTGVEPPEVVSCFQAGAWSESGDFDNPLMFRELEQRKIEVIILQYQNGIFNDQNLVKLFQYCRERQIQVIVTFHDSCIGPQFPFHLVEHYVCSHSKMQEIIHRCHYIPHGVPAPVFESKETLKHRYDCGGPVVATFGLGRTNYHLISRVSKKLGYRFMVMDSTGSCLIGGDHIIRIRQWLPMDQLVNRLAAADAVVLWYPDIDAYVSSSAVCQALATLRLVIVNDVRWFKDIPKDVAIRVKDEQELYEKLSTIDKYSGNPKQLEYVLRHQWRQIAQKYLELLGGNE